jgi:hypothetical protein
MVVSKILKMTAETVRDGVAGEEKPPGDNEQPRPLVILTSWNHRNILLFSEKESKRTDFEMVVPRYF